MDEANSNESMYDFLVAQCGIPPPYYEDRNCKKKGGKPKCVCRTAKPTAAAAATAKGHHGHQAKPDAATAAKKRPPSPWAAAAVEFCDDEPKKRRAEAKNDGTADCPPPTPPPSPSPSQSPSQSQTQTRPSRCGEIRCACRRSRCGRPCEDDPCRRRVNACAARCARKCDDYDDVFCCRCDGPSSVAAAHSWYGAAFDWLCGRAWNVVFAAVAFFAGMYVNDYCRCVYDDDS